MLNGECGGRCQPLGRRVQLRLAPGGCPLQGGNQIITP
jgi:hypothetical protein